MAAGDVDADRQVGPLGDSPVPVGKPPAGLVQDPAAEIADETALLGERDELARRHVPPLGVLPAGKGLDAADPARPQRQRRLVVELELAVDERLPEVRLELAPFE